MIAGRQAGCPQCLGLGRGHGHVPEDGRVNHLPFATADLGPDHGIGRAEGMGLLSTDHAMVGA
jgi:hypothetical protein